MSPSRGGSLRLLLSVIALVAFGVVFGFWAATSIGPRTEGMTATGGAGSGMPGMTMPGMAMPPQAPGGSGGRTAELAAAHADVEAARFAQAVPVYERILREDPHHVEALIHYGAALAGVPRAAWDETRVADCMLPLAQVPVLNPNLAVVDALPLVAGSEVRRALIVEGGRLEGILSIADLLRALEVGGPHGTADR